MKQSVLDMGVGHQPSLDNFLDPQGHNAPALEHLRLWSRALERSALPTYLWGAPGSGKTHLLRAIASGVEQSGGSYGFMSAHAPQAQEYQSDWAVLILDDVHLYTATQQQAAFNWFVQAQTDKRWVLAAGDTAPAQLQLREDLRSRFGWGHIFELAVMSESERQSVLESAAQARGLVLTPELIHYILQRFSRDLSSLMQLLDHLDYYSLATKRPLSTALVRKMLQDME